MNHQGWVEVRPPGEADHAHGGEAGLEAGPAAFGATFAGDERKASYPVASAQVGADAVRANFERDGLLDDQVRFLEGWFCDTLPDEPIERLAMLRLDGDLFQSTMDALVALEPKVSSGGYVIVDDDFGWESCGAAVDDYRATNGITAPIARVDWTGAWWQKPC